MFTKEFSVQAVVFASPDTPSKITIDVLRLPVFEIDYGVAFQPVVFEIHPGLDCSAGIILKHGAFEQVVLINSFVLEAAIFEIAEAGPVAFAVTVNPFGHQLARRVV